MYTENWIKAPIDYSLDKFSQFACEIEKYSTVVASRCVQYNTCTWPSNLSQSSTTLLNRYFEHSREKPHKTSLSCNTLYSLLQPSATRHLTASLIMSMQSRFSVHLKEKIINGTNQLVNITKNRNKYSAWV
jgi:hypothetical protein